MVAHCDNVKMYLLLYGSWLSCLHDSHTIFRYLKLCPPLSISQLDFFKIDTFSEDNTPICFLPSFFFSQL